MSQGWKRKELQDGSLGDFFAFVNGDLLPYLRGLRDQPNASLRQKVISQVLSGVERTRIDTEKNFLDILDKIYVINQENIDETHIFTLSQVYEGLLLKMGERGNDGGSSLRPVSSFEPWSKPLTQSWARPFTTQAAAPGAFWPRLTTTSARG